MTYKVNSKNLFQGPPEVYVGTINAVEPAGTDVEPGTGWKSVGGTNGGAKATFGQETSPLQVDQSPYEAGAVVTKRTAQIETTMAEGTLDNLVTGLGTGSVVDNEYEPADGAEAAQPNYVKVLMRGPRNQAGDKRDVIIRRGMSSEGLEIENSKTNQGGFKVTWKAFYVDSETRPYKISDKKAGGTPTP